MPRPELLRAGPTTSGYDCDPTMASSKNVSAAFGKLEEQLERMLERPLGRLFGGKIEPADLANRLSRAMEDGQIVAAGRRLVPNRYEITLHPADLAEFQSFEGILVQEMGAYLMGLARQREYTLVGRPDIALSVDTTLARGDIAVAARLIDLSQSESPLLQQHTSPMKIPQRLQSIAARPRSCLVFQDRRISLDAPLVTIGRHLDNDIILESKCVSRYHAHIKPRQSHYYLTDLASANGTTVNGKPITECVLQDGDVISFGDLEMVFRNAHPA
ncbi:MAG: DUF3662 domain-containing protein [Chloroflexi bacterium]|nr:DUF3662 domain-containing protein [Chloroflexota bacterium]